MTDYIKLTAKQEKFCQNIVSGMNQLQAYENAYPIDNSLEKTKTENASRLAAQPKIAARIQQLNAPAIEKAQINAEEIILDLKEIKNDRKIRVSDRLKALELLGKTIAMFTDRQEMEHSGEFGVIRLPMKLPEGAPVQTEFGEKVEIEGDER